MAYAGDQLQSVDNTKPQDTDPESSIGQALRDLKSAILDWAKVEHALTGKHLRAYAVDTGVANAAIVSISHQITSLDAGFHLYFVPIANNTNASTVDVTANSVNLGLYSIKKGGTDNVAPGDILAGRVTHLVFDGTNFQLVNPATATAISGSGDGAQVLLNNYEGTFSLVSGISAETLLGSGSLPENEYAKILMTAEIEMQTGGSNNDFEFRMYREAELLTTRRVRAMNRSSGSFPWTAHIALSHIFNGGQTADQTVYVRFLSDNNNANFGAILRNLRIYGY